MKKYSNFNSGDLGKVHKLTKSFPSNSYFKVNGNSLSINTKSGFSTTTKVSSSSAKNNK